MEGHIQYRLKAAGELKSLLADTDSLFVIACNKCFGQLGEASEEDADEFEKIAIECGKTVTGSAKIDFLCNKLQTEKELRHRIPPGTENIYVISCGLGIQTLADLTPIRVYAASDSPKVPGHHGLTLDGKVCDACAQCYLTHTAGICPIVDCAKGLINGQCGGAKNGKCEVDPNMDCAWEKILRRMDNQGRLIELTGQPVQIRDHSKVNFKVIQDYVRFIRDKRFEGFYGGVHPSGKKNSTMHLPLTRLPEPETVVIPMSMHMGTPAEPTVQVGQRVQIGQMIGKASGPISSNIHSSVSGVVTAVQERPHATKGNCLSVVIASDGKYTVHESVRPVPDPDALTREQLLSLIREKGIVGMGGSGFPTDVKLDPAKPVDTVVLNGCECEPYLTADHRVLLECSDDVLFGLKMMMKAVGAGRGILVIEDNQPDAIEGMRAKTAHLDGIGVCAVRTKYPQGAEKMLVKRVMGRQVPRGGLPTDVGCVVCNVSTAKAVADAIKTGMPLVERAVTVSGEYIPKPGNFIVRIGTSAGDLIGLCGGITAANATVKIGGPMMGVSQSDLNVPVMKTTNGILAIDTCETVPQECIKCGRCVDVCPMELKPLYFVKHSDDAAALKERRIMDCLECGCCEYICASGIRLVSLIRNGKAQVRGMM